MTNDISDPIKDRFREITHDYYKKRQRRLEREADYVAATGDISIKRLARMGMETLADESNPNKLIVSLRGAAKACAEISEQDIDAQSQKAAELISLICARDCGDIGPLEYRLRAGLPIEHPETKKFLASRLRGDKLPRGQKPTLDKYIERFFLLGNINSIQLANNNCSETKALQIYLDENPDLNEDSVKTDLRRGKRQFKVR